MPCIHRHPWLRFSSPHHTPGKGISCPQCTSGKGRKIRETQETLLTARKTEAIAQLASGLAHEFTNIMTAVVGYSDVISRKPSDNAPRYAMLIKEAGMRAGALTERLLSFSRQQLLQPRLTNVMDLLAGVETALKKAHLGVKVVTELDSPSADAEIDPEQLRRAIRTLVNRAAQNAGRPGL